MKRILFVALLTLLPTMLMAQRQGGEVKRPQKKQPTTASKKSMTLEEMYNLGCDYEHARNGKPQNYQEAVKWYRKAADKGYAKAQYSLGLCYGDGKGVSHDDSQAVYWYRKAADQGLAWSQLTLGYHYESGRGVTQDYSQAVYWYRKAAEQGLASGQCNLGNMYYNGTGVPKDNSQARYWWEKAAAQGEQNAINNLKLLN